MITPLIQFLFTTIILLVGALAWFVQNYLAVRSAEVKTMRDELEKQKLVTTEIQTNYLTRFEAVNKHVESVRVQMILTEANITTTLTEKVHEIQVTLATIQGGGKDVSKG